MPHAIIIAILALGTTSGLLIFRAYPIARALWPGPSVKGPGDVYVQAFQTLLCMAVLGLLALVAAIASFVLSRRAGWSAGQWLSVLPVASAGLVLAIALLTRGR